MCPGEAENAEKYLCIRKLKDFTRCPETPQNTPPAVILNLSDPPWHTACPNPFLGEFVEARGKPCEPGAPYRRKPFAVDVSPKFHDSDESTC